MRRYRYAQHRNFSARLRGGINFKQQGYFANTTLDIKGWFAAKQEPVDALNVYVYGKRKRLLKRFEALLPSPDIKEALPQFAGAGQSRYQLRLDERFSELKNGDDFALEFVVEFTTGKFTAMTLTFICDKAPKQALFIVGSPRSGTSILGNSLSRALATQTTFSESHLLPLVNQLGKITRDYYHHGAANLPGMMLHETSEKLLAEQFKQVLKQRYQQAFGRGWLVDKTPGGPMLSALPEVLRLWPEAYIIFAKRRGIENVMSRLNKFPDGSFESHCKEWRHTMDYWRSLQPKLARSLEIDQFDIQQDPEGVSKALSNYLELNAEQESVLLSDFQTKRPEQTHSVSELKAVSLDNTSWTKAQIAFFREHCGDTMRSYGYSDTGTYYEAVVPA